jgi:hypothetical protein
MESCIEGEHTCVVGLYGSRSVQCGQLSWNVSKCIQGIQFLRWLFVNKELSLPVTEPAKNHEWNRIRTMARNNGFPSHIIHRIRNDLTSPTWHHTTEHTPRKTWIPFTFHSPLIYKVTNLFRCTPLQITFRPTNTIFRQLHWPHFAMLDNSGVYGLWCTTCHKVYVGQSGHSITTRYWEHTRYVRTNTPHSAYALHILNTQHKHGPPEHTLHMLESCHKANFMNIWENFCMQ